MLRAIAQAKTKANKGLIFVDAGSSTLTKNTYQEGQLIWDMDIIIILNTN